jgi:flagellar hook-length control protein FliK
MNTAVPMMTKPPVAATSRNKESISATSAKPDQDFSKAMDAAMAGKQEEKGKVSFESKEIGESDSEIDSSTSENQSIPIPMMPFASIVIPQTIPQVITQVAPPVTPVMQNIDDQSEVQGAAALSSTIPSQNQVVRTANKSDLLMENSSSETKSVEVPGFFDPASSVVPKSFPVQEQANSVPTSSNTMSDQTSNIQSDSAAVISATSFGVEVTHMMQPNSKDRSSIRAVESLISEKEAITTEVDKDGAGHDVPANLGVGSTKSKHNSDEFAPVNVSSASTSTLPKEKAVDVHERETITTNNKLLPDDSSKKETKSNENVFSEVLQQRTSSIEPKSYVSDTKSVTSQFVKDTHQITSQIVEQAQVLKNNQETQMIIKLKPEHLGELTLKVTVDSGVVSASFHSDNAEVRSVIESSLVQLKQEMSNQGLKVDNVGVYAGLGQFLSNGQREAPQQPVVKFKNKRAGEEAFEDSEKVVDNLKTGTETGVDYRI